MQKSLENAREHELIIAVCVCLYQHPTENGTLLIAKQRLSLKQATSQRISKFHRAIWPQSMEELRGPEQQPIIRRLPQAQHLDQVHDNLCKEACLRLVPWRTYVKPCLSRVILADGYCTGFTIPGPHSPFYNGQYLADSEDVVVVTPKYEISL